MVRPAAFVAVCLSLLASPSAAQLTPVPQDLGATGLGLALRRLPVTTRVLYVTAHPDDENNAVLVALARGRGASTALLTLTRGDGGQNAVGPELFEALGVLRSEELAAVHRWDGAEQYFGHAYEFGFSVDLEETFRRWGREATLGDVVRVVRLHRPDVILTLPLEAPGHQHHTAAARLARDAFRAAADPGRFPEHLREGLRPWQARKIYQGGVGGGALAPEGVRAVTLSVGDYDPLLGMTWSELGSLARTRHRSQAQSQLKLQPGELTQARFALVDAEPAVDGPEADLLDGLDGSIRGLTRFAPDQPAISTGLEALEADVQRALEAFSLLAPHRTVAPLARGLARLRELAEAAADSDLAEAARSELLHRLEAKEADFLEALARAQGIAFDATAEDSEVAPGQSLRVAARVWNPGPDPLPVEGVELQAPEGWTVRRAQGEARTLEAGESLPFVLEVQVAPGAQPTQPYWRRAPGADRYEVAEPAYRNLPWTPPELRAVLRYRAGDVAARVERPVARRSAGRWVGGEKRKVVNVVPALSLRLAPGFLVFPTSGRPTRELRLTLRGEAHRGAPADAWLEVPAGWRTEPLAHRVVLGSEGEERTVRFRVTPPARLAPGRYEIRAVAVLERQEFRQGYQAIAYDHVQERHFYSPAEARALALDLRIGTGVSVGYVAGAGDEVDEAIRQLGVPVAPLGPNDLAWGDLDRFSTIVLGVRAYQARADLRAHHQRLMDYVTRGGNLLVQYHRGEFNPPGDAPSPFAPYPARVSTRRVTDETAPVQVRVPSSPLFTRPNRIGAADWEGWVQERGIQFLDARDARYVELLASADPFPANPETHEGILVEARVGKGTWTYVGLVLFRQLPAGTPGAYRLLANLVSRPRGR